MNCNFNKLKGRIVEVLGTREAFCEKMGFTHATLYNTFKGKRDFTSSEIDKACDILGLEGKDIPTYFFNKNN